MTGIEAGAVQVGGRILAGIAAPAAQALARKVTFRWAVARRVRRRVEFPCHWGTYRKWLKSLTGDELACPVEDMHGPLACRLDEALTAASSTWASAEEHLSRALRLVELTYPAIAAVLGEADRVELAAHWSHERSATVREHLLQLVGPEAALGSTDLAIALQRRSHARRTVRLQAFDVDEEGLEPYFQRIQPVDVPVGSVRVLLGGFGSGKSEVAEAWHRQAIVELQRQANSPLPTWLSAKASEGKELEAAIDGQLGHAWRRGRGASVVIDGLDEAPPATAQTLLESARLIVQLVPNVRFLLTARHGSLSPTEQEELNVELLSDEEALELVALAGGRPHDTWRWTASMQETVERPFFALAAGRMLARDRAPRGEADLIRNLVESALAKGTERSAITAGETRMVLETLAVAITRADADGLSFANRQVALSSRLVAEGPRGSVHFSLPILQHWFAAQALLNGNVPADEVVADALAFSRWRWAAAVAALSATTADAIDRLLVAWVASNPGAAGWIMNEAFRGHREWREEGDASLDAAASGRRLLLALRTWSDALASFAHGLLPTPLVDGPVELGVTARGHRIDIAFATTAPAEDCVTEVPMGVHPFVPYDVPGWRPWISGGAPVGESWPWLFVKKQIASGTLKKLSEDPFLGSPSGVWVQERRFDLARELIRRGSHSWEELPADRVRERAVEFFDLIDRDRRGRISINNSSKFFSGAELQELVTYIDEVGLTSVAPPVPTQDARPPGISGWVWDFYSPERLAELEVGVYGRACEAYDEALNHEFRPFGWSMSNTAIAPFGVLLEISYGPSAFNAVTPSLAVVRVPMQMFEELASSEPRLASASNGRAVISQAPQDDTAQYERHRATLEAVRSWLLDHRREPLGGLGWAQTIADDMAQGRPASSIAANWLWDDLKNLGLGEGTFPQLR